MLAQPDSKSEQMMNLGRPVLRLIGLNPMDSLIAIAIEADADQAFRIETFDGKSQSFGSLVESFEEVEVPVLLIK